MPAISSGSVGVEFGPQQEGYQLGLKHEGSAAGFKTARARTRTPCRRKKLPILRLQDGGPKASTLNPVIGGGYQNGNLTAYWGI